MNTAKAKTKVFKIHSGIVVLFMVLILGFYGCESPFVPLQENNRFHYSMYGFLDTSMNTQWIRVMPVRESLALSEVPIDAKVTLIKNSTGEESELMDSLFVFYSSPDDPFYVRNFHTDFPIEFDEEYTVIAERSDGEKSIVKTYVPPIFDPPVFGYNENTFSGVLEGQVDNRLVVLDVEYFCTIVDKFGNGSKRRVKVSQIEREKVFIQENGKYRVNIGDRRFIADQFLVSQGDVFVDSANIFIGVGGDDWPYIEGLSNEEAALPESANNVENGTGLVLGVASLTMPFKSCKDANNELIPCPPKNVNSKITGQ